MIFESPILAFFDKEAKLGKTSGYTYNQGGWLILWDLLNEWIDKGVASNINDFNCVGGII